MNLLEAMMARQASAQAASHGGRLADLEGEDRIEAIRWNVLALEDELHEALNETGWKPWASSRHVNEQALQGELIDAWHFLMNLFDLAHMSPEDVSNGYHAKRDKNDTRQVLGYDGVAGKCTTCHRALDDFGVMCTDTMCAA